MAQSVVYADLKFAMAPPSTNPAGPTAHDEDDSPYENMPLGTVTTVPSPGHWPRRWRVPAGLLAASLLLLLVATVALGACYWQLTRRLQDTSREHAAEQGRLSQDVMAREQSLEQARLELAWARAELQRAWREGNSSRLELGSLDVELDHTRRELVVMKEQLRASESNVSRLRACVNTECCPEGWVLYRSKCLFISVMKKSWWESYDDCRRKSAWLLTQGNWPSWTVPATGATYWIGAQYFPDTKSVVWQNSKQDYVYSRSADCMLLNSKLMMSSKCSKSYQWICEQPPNLDRTSETLLPLPVED